MKPEAEDSWSRGIRANHASGWRLRGVLKGCGECLPCKPTDWGNALQFRRVRSLSMPKESLESDSPVSVTLETERTSSLKVKPPKSLYMNSTTSKVKRISTVFTHGLREPRRKPL